MKTILYSVPTGYLARNLLRTGVIEKLLLNDDIRIVIVSPGYDNEDFRKEFSFSDRIFIEKMHEVPRHFDFFDKVIYKFWLLAHELRIFQYVYKLLLKIQTAKRYYDKYHHLYKPIFDKYEPNLIVGASIGGSSSGGFPILAEARKRGIKILVLINSWDNISKRKGAMRTRPDILAVWNESQKEEALKWNFFKSSDVIIVGAPNFDLYWEKDTFFEKDRFFEMLNLNPAKKLIVITATLDNIVTNTYIIDILIDALKKGKFVAPVQLLFRPSPSLGFEQNVAEYKSYYNNPSVIIDRNSQFLTELGWNPKKEQIIYFANLMKHCDVLVNIASTATLEATIVDKPIVNIAFSTAEPELFQRRIVGSVFKNHYKPILDMKATYLAKDPNDLVAGVNRYLTNPSLEREKRKNLKNTFIGKTDGGAVEKITQLILRLIR